VEKRRGFSSLASLVYSREVGKVLSILESGKVRKGSALEKGDLSVTLLILKLDVWGRRRGELIDEENRDGSGGR